MGLKAQYKSSRFCSHNYVPSKPISKLKKSLASNSLSDLLFSLSLYVSLSLRFSLSFTILFDHNDPVWCLETSKIYFRFHTETSWKKHRRRKRKFAPLSTLACIQKVQRTIKKETQEAVEGKPCVVKIYLGTEEDKDYSSIECIVVTLQTVLDMDDEIFLEACELLGDGRKAKMFVAFLSSIFLVNVRYNFGTFLLGSFSNVN